MVMQLADIDQDKTGYLLLSDNFDTNIRSSTLKSHPRLQRLEFTAFTYLASSDLPHLELHHLSCSSSLPQRLNETQTITAIT